MLKSIAIGALAFGILMFFVLIAVAVLVPVPVPT
jgi:hypothetical protein